MPKRLLVAIMFTDMARYMALMQEDETDAKKLAEFKLKNVDRFYESSAPLWVPLQDVSRFEPMAMKYKLI